MAAPPRLVGDEAGVFRGEVSNGWLDSWVGDCDLLPGEGTSGFDERLVGLPREGAVALLGAKTIQQ